MRANWSIELPRGYAEKYAYTETSFRGDGVRYHVLVYPDSSGAHSEKRISELEKLFSNSTSPTDEAIDETWDWLASVNISSVLLPNFASCKMLYRVQKDNSRQYLFGVPPRKPYISLSALCRARSTLFRTKNEEMRLFPMKLETVQCICYAIIALLSVLLFLLILAKNAVFGYAASGVCVVYGIFNVSFWRCPACGKALGPLGMQSFCRHRGEEPDS